MRIRFGCGLDSRIYGTSWWRCHLTEANNLTQCTAGKHNRLLLHWNFKKWICNVIANFCCTPLRLYESTKPLGSHKNTGYFISPSGTSELGRATTTTDTAERSISIGREFLQVFFGVLGTVAYCPFAVTIPATAPQRSEIVEGLMNYPVYINTFSFYN